MSRTGQILWSGIRGCFAGIWSFAVWALWLALALLLVAQLYVFTANELAVPDLVLRRLEDQLAASGIRLTFSRTSFDPKGRILIEDVRAFLPEYAEPVFTARAIYSELNPWMLAVGMVDAQRIRVSGASAFVPAMLSASGRPEEILQNVEATLSPQSRLWIVHQFSARVAGIAVSAHGIVPGPPRSAAPRPGLPALIASHFPALCRQVIDWSDRLTAFDTPSIALELGASDAGSMLIDATLLAQSARLTDPIQAEAQQVRITTQALLLGSASTSRIEFDAAELRLPSGIAARRVQGFVLGGLSTAGGLRFIPRELELTANAVTRGPYTVEALSAEILPRALPRLDATLFGYISGAPLAVRTRADFEQQTASAEVRGQVAPALLTPLSQDLKVDVRRHFDFEGLELESASVQLGPKWKFESLAARIRLHHALARGVRLDEGRATLRFDGRRIEAREAYARIGDNFARGSYEHDLGTNGFRFLLNGQLRPMDISGWFRPWWTNFFRQFEFPAAGPIASVDVKGVWRDGRQAAVFVFAETPKALVRGGTFEDLQTRLYVRPGFYHGLEVHARNGPGRVDGTFLYTVDWTTRLWRDLHLNLRSTIPADVAVQVIGPISERFMAPFVVSAPPDIVLQAQFAGPAAVAGRHHRVDATIRAPGELRFNEFPVQDASFALSIQDDEISVRDLEASFASGVIGGRARVWGAGANRRVGFDVSLNDASLGESVSKVQGFFARRRGEAAPPPGRFVQEKASVRIELAASAEGGYGDPFSYQGSGNAVLRGAEIGAVPLLGTLSETLKFTTLRFTEARGTFQIEGPRLQFSEVTLRGANSAIDAHGAYALDARTLDFNVKVFPFQESENLVKSVVGAVLSPLSKAMEVKLTGSLEKPEWHFLLLGSLAAPASPAGKAAAPPDVALPPADNLAEDKRLPPPP